MSRRRHSCLVGVCSALTVVLFFWPFFSSGGDLLSGDIADNRLLIVILEHWRAWVFGQASLPDPNYFAPAKGVLGYSVALGLYVPLYLLSRVAGFDRYLSFQFTLICVKLIGFLSFYAILRRILCFPSVPSLYGAALFTLSSTYFVSLGHGQLASVAFLPLVVLLAAKSWLTRERCLTSSAFAGIAALLYGLLFLTEYYTPFFFALTITTVFLIYAVLELWRNPSKASQSAMGIIRSVFPQILVAGLVFAASLIPVAIIYLPIYRESGGRAFPDVETQMLGIIQIFSPGPSNLVWDGIIRQFPGLFQLDVPREIGRGWSPFTLTTFVVAASILIPRGLRSDSTAAHRFVAASCLGAIVLALVATRLGGLMPWRLVYEFFPGAKGIRVPGRLNLVVNLIVVTVAVGFLHKRLEGSGVRSDFGRRITAICFCGILLLEQLNWGAFPGYSRQDEFAYFLRIPPPPSGCHTFYVSRSTRPLSDWGSIDAMLLARQYNLPTINGYSGLTPKGWRCPIDQKACEQDLLEWASRHNLTDSLCALDLISGQWSGPPVSLPSLRF